MARNFGCYGSAFSAAQTVPGQALTLRRTAPRSCAQRRARIHTGCQDNSRRQPTGLKSPWASCSWSGCEPTRTSQSARKNLRRDKNIQKYVTQEHDCAQQKIVPSHSPICREMPDRGGFFLQSLDASFFAAMVAGHVFCCGGLARLCFAVGAGRDFCCESLGRVFPKGKKP